MPIRPEKRSDCSRCAALCCIAYPAEKSPGFAASKRAGEACPKLDRAGKCTIYGRRTEQGFSGCLEYECFGAGQHVVQELFGGRDWRDDPALLSPMLECFLTVRKACDLLYLIDYARERGVPDRELATLAALEEELVAIAGTREAPGSHAVLDRIERHLRSLFAGFDRAEA